MSLRMRISDALKQAMKDKAADRLSTLRLINAAIKDKDIAARANGKDEGVSDAEVLGILSKMAKQRQESARAYEEGGRLDLAEREREEVEVRLSARQLTVALDDLAATLRSQFLRRGDGAEEVFEAFAVDHGHEPRG